MTPPKKPVYTSKNASNHKELSKPVVDKSLADALAMPNADAVEFEPPRISERIFKPADFS